MIPHIAKNSPGNSVFSQTIFNRATPQVVSVLQLLCPLCVSRSRADSVINHSHDCSLVYIAWEYRMKAIRSTLDLNRTKYMEVCYKRTTKVSSTYSPPPPLAAADRSIIIVFKE